MEPCTVCGTPLAPTDVLYTAEAKVVCAACNDKADLLDTDKRAARNIVRAAWGSVGAGVAAMLGPLAMLGIITYMFVAIAWVSAGFAVQSLGRSADNDRFTKHLSSAQRSLVWVCSTIGFALGALAASGYAAKLAFWVIGKT